MNMRRRLAILLAAPMLLPASAGWSAQPDLHPVYPRLMGMNIGEKNYDDAQYQAQLARLHIVI